MIVIRSRDLSSEVAARLKAWAKLKGLSVSAGAAQLLEMGLNHLDARKAGGQARQSKLTDDQRTEIGRRMAEARWRPNRS